MRSFIKGAGFTSTLVLALTTVAPNVVAAQVNNTVREGQGAITELSPNASGYHILGAGV